MIRRAALIALGLLFATPAEALPKRGAGITRKKRLRRLRTKTPARPPGPLLAPPETVGRDELPMKAPQPLPEEEPGSAGTDETATDSTSEDSAAESAPASAPFADFELQGFFDARSLLVWRAAPGEALLAPLLPEVSSTRSYLQINAQPRLFLWDRRIKAFGDATFFMATAGLKHLFLLNELYAEGQVAGPVYLTAGRRRVVWGSGLAFNPTDLLNPPKNPLNLDQRTGAFFLPMVEVVTAPVTVTMLYTPELATNAWSLPKSLDFARGKAAARVYTSLADTDLNAVYYRDFARKQNAVGVSASRFFGSLVELHVEALGHGGGPNGFPIPVVPGCGSARDRDPRIAVTGLAGIRLEWPDQTFVSAEYIYNGDGLSNRAYDQMQNVIPCLAAALQGSRLPEPNPVGQPFDLPFVLLRKNYAILLFQRAHLADGVLENVSLAANLIVGLDDVSTIGQLSAGYSFGGVATVRASALFWSFDGRGQFGLLPPRSAVIADVRVSY